MLNDGVISHFDSTTLLHDALLVHIKITSRVSLNVFRSQMYYGIIQKYVSVGNFSSILIEELYNHTKELINVLIY
jgi:hypothetical protein